MYRLLMKLFFSVIKFIHDAFNNSHFHNSYKDKKPELKNTIGAVIIMAIIMYFILLFY